MQDTKIIKNVKPASNKKKEKKVSLSKRMTKMIERMRKKKEKENYWSKYGRSRYWDSKRPERRSKRKAFKKARKVYFMHKCA